MHGFPLANEHSQRLKEPCKEGQSGKYPPGAKCSEKLMKIR